MTHAKTPKGTELPIIKLKGKDYLEVKYRLVWFREDHPDWSIQTEYVSRTADSALAKATIRNDAGEIMSTSHKYEDAKGFGDFMEKAETGAIGRALALVGYGTQFCGDDLDEGSRIVDAPAQRLHAPRAVPSPPAWVSESAQEEIGFTQPPKAAQAASQSAPDGYIADFGKYDGRRLEAVPKKELAEYVAYLEKTVKESGKPMGLKVQKFVREAQKFI